jgi:acetyltransferase-like isoleucine patch superfamily enzyme
MVNADIEITIPRETVNDDFVTIVKWYHASGSQVQAGERLLSFETSKAVNDIEAAVGGYLEIQQPEGAEVAIGEVVGYLLAQPVNGRSVSKTGQSLPAAAALGQQFSQKAHLRIEREGIDPQVFEGIGLVREADVIRFLNGVQKPQDTQPTATASPTVPLMAQSIQPQKKGLLFDARSSARDRGKGVLWLACNYFLRNYLLGNLVRWAPRGVILWLHRMRGVRMGKDCFVDPTALLETAYPEKITLGNDVRITAHAVIMAHIKGPHYLRQTGIAPSVIKPVVFEDHCFIGVNSVIMPGVTVGKAAIVASGAVVVNNVPAYSIVAGNPARVIKRFPHPEEGEMNHD